MGVLRGRQDSRLTLHDGSEMDVRDLIERWREEAAVCRKRGAVGQAEAVDSCADELEAHAEEWLNGEVTIAEAAALSGYSCDHLRTLVKEGTLRATRRGSRIRIQRRDLPRKPRREKSTVEALAAETTSQHDPPTEPSEVERIAARLAGSRIPE